MKMKTAIATVLLGIAVASPSFADDKHTDDEAVYLIVSSVLAYEKACGNGTLDPVLRRKFSQALGLIPQVSETKFRELADKWFQAIKTSGCARAELMLSDRIRAFKQ
jgi:hypothetical protein